MPEKAQIARRLKEWAGLKVGPEWGWQKRIADLLGMTPQQINNLLAGRKPVGPAIRERLVKAGADVDWIMSGRRVEPGAREPVSGYHSGPFMEVPVIGKVLATPDGKQYFEDLREGVTVPYFKGPYFALVVENDSLIHAPDDERSMPIYPDDIVLFDSQRQPKNGDIVAVQMKQSNERMIKVLHHKNRDEVELRSFNTFRNYPSVTVKKHTIASFGVFVTVLKLSRAERRRLGL